MQGSRPVRLAGFVLIGIAVVAVGLGVFALTGNGSNQAAPPAGRPPVTTTTHPVPTTTHPPRPTTTTRPAPTTTTTTTTTTAGPTTTIAPPPTSRTVVQSVGVRVYNNSLIKDLAAKAATDFRNAGYDVVFVGNYSQGVIPHSTVYFSPAPGEQQVATQLAQAFGMQVMPRFPGIAAASPGVIVILTEDFTGAK